MTTRMFTLTVTCAARTRLVMTSVRLLTALAPLTMLAVATMTVMVTMPVMRSVVIRP